MKFVALYVLFKLPSIGIGPLGESIKDDERVRWPSTWCQNVFEKIIAKHLQKSPSTWQSTITSIPIAKTVPRTNVLPYPPDLVLCAFYLLPSIKHLYRDTVIKGGESSISEALWVVVTKTLEEIPLKVNGIRFFTPCPRTFSLDYVQHQTASEKILQFWPLLYLFL